MGARYCSKFPVEKFIGLLLLLSFLLPAVGMAAVPLSEREAKQLAAEYYVSQGEWAGKFQIVKYLKSRYEPAQGEITKVHFQYEWAFIKDPTRTGTDSRYFVYQHVNNGWRVVEMGPHQSGRL